MTRPRYGTPLRGDWFLSRPAFRFFMLREATAIFIALYLVFLLVWLRRLGGGPEAFASLQALIRHPVSWVLHAIIFGAALYHSITWFNLTPKIMPMYIGEDRVADTWAAIAMGYFPWIVVTAVVLWGATR